ncbi:MAG: hypothetical protein ACTFAL_15640 [Candidatus Electronema sp. V4]|uniref:hypothetical protein n=1 Tax=Candidatus Electronema sp. V4 TaxID=3454756 RepID=UPI0040553B26
MIKDNFNLSFDLSGNLLLTIPKSYLQNADQKTLLKSVERLIRSARKKINFSSDWNGDSAADVVGICESNMNDGSVHHDRDIYGLE